MSDNITLSTNVGAGSVMRTKDRAGVETQIVALDLNPGGSESLMAGSIPVTLASLATLATVAKQPALGTAGTASADVITVQGIASMTALKVDGSAVTQPISIAASVAVTEADGANVTLGAKADAKSTATDTTAISVVSILKQISASVQAPPSQAVTNAGTFAVQVSSALPAGTNVIGHVIVDSGTITVGNASLAVTGTFWQATQPVSLASVPSHAVTNAGTFAVQSAMSGTWTVATTADCNAAPGSPPGKCLMVGMIYTSSPPSPTDGQSLAMHSDSAGNLNVNVAAATSLTVGTHAVTQSGTWTVGLSAAQTLATVTTVTTVSTVTSLSQFAGNAINLGTGNTGTGTLRVVLATDQPALTNAQPVTQVPGTSGGLSVSRVIDFSGSNQGQTQIKASAGQIFGWAVFNTNAAARYLKIYNKAAPTSADTPILTLTIPGATTGAGMVAEFNAGIAFATAIGMRVTTAYADNDTGAAAAGDVIVNVLYK